MSIQRQITIDGLLAACPTCARQPKHFETLGKHVHHLECAPCGTRTPKFGTFNEAVESWEKHEISLHVQRAA